MNINNTSLEQKVEALCEEVSEIKEQLKTFLSLSNISIEDALLNARRITEYVVNDVIQREGYEVQRDLMDNLETLGSRDDKSRKRRNGKEPILPYTIYSGLHNLRIYGNSIAHPFEPGTTKLKNIAVNTTDIQIVLGHLLRTVEWFFQEYEKGPLLKSLFDIANINTSSSTKRKKRIEESNILLPDNIKLAINSWLKRTERIKPYFDDPKILSIADKDDLVKNILLYIESQRIKVYKTNTYALIKLKRYLWHDKSILDYNFIRGVIFIEKINLVPIEDQQAIYASWFNFLSPNFKQRLAISVVQFNNENKQIEKYDLWNRFQDLSTGHTIGYF
jgi:hypothetical protein